MTEGEAAPAAVGGAAARAQSPDARRRGRRCWHPLAIAIAYVGGWLWAVLVTLAAIGLYVEWLTIVGAARAAAGGRLGRRRRWRSAGVVPRARTHRSLRSSCWRSALSAVAALTPERRVWAAAGFGYAAAAETGLGAAAARSGEGLDRADAGASGGLGDRYRRLFRRPRHRRAETVAAGQPQQDLGRRDRRLCRKPRGGARICRVRPRQDRAAAAARLRFSRSPRNSAICSNRR